MALKYLRDNLKHLKWVLWFIVFVFILLVFVDWGTGRRGGRTGGAAVRVGDHKITEQQFLREVRDTEQRFEKIYGKNWPQLRNRINLAQQTAQEIIQRELLLEEARRAGLRVSPQELREKILSFPAFRRQDGSFVGQSLYARILRANQTTPDEFENRLRQDILLQKLQDLVGQAVFVSDAEVEAELRRTRESADFDLIDVPIDSFLKGLDAGDAEVKAYYEAHKDEFKHPEQRVIRYLVVETNRLRRLLPVSDQEIASYYKEHKDEFRVGEQAHARHILIRVDPAAGPEAAARAKAKAEAIAKMARAGADFAALARKHSQDPGSKDRGGDLGWFGRGSMVKAFEDAVFSHKPGDIVGPIKSQFGYHIIKVEGFKPARQKPLSEVKDQVKFRLLESRAAAEAESRAAKLEREVRAAKPTTDAAWQKIADEDEAVVLNVSPPFAEGQAIPGIGDNPELVKAVFAAKVGDIGTAVPISRGWIVWQLKQIIPAGVPPLKTIRAQVAAKVVRDKALKAAHEKAAELAAKWRAGADGQALARAVGTRVISVRSHRRRTAVPGLGVVEALDRAVFAARDGDVVGPVDLGDRGVAVAKIVAVKKLSAAELAAGMPAVRKRLEAERANALLGSILNERRRNTVVAVDSEIIQRFAPKGDQG
jgi:Parvulin-like peptidyl-prolyl isomerase